MSKWRPLINPYPEDFRNGKPYGNAKIWQDTVDSVIGEPEKMEPAGYWWCDHCKEEVRWDHATFNAKHDGCGYPLKWIELKPVAQTFHNASELAGILPAEAVIVRPVDSLTATLIFDLLEERCPHSEGCAKRFCYLCMRDLKKKFCGG